ncbi:MAG: class I SAM-dependent methyltransferase [Peptococcaceae bacterium]|jgi:ubiquinone/menaquinone biosynthesis C-methylase UbiE|nr:class I SAM-dependent methyltransferase [Peptococcaceae bacterium]
MSFSGNFTANAGVMSMDVFRVTEQLLTTHDAIVGKEVLEVGCGDGRMTALFQKNALRVTGIDSSAEAIELAQKNVPGVDFLVQSGEALSFPDKMFDTVLFSLSLHHHDDPSAALSEAMRVARAGGRIMVIEPAIDCELMQVCLPFDAEEGPGLERANAALSKYTPHETHTLYPVWQFYDAAALHAWLAEYYAATDTPENHALADAIIAHKRNDKPLFLQDKIHVLLFPTGVSRGRGC